MLGAQRGIAHGVLHILGPPVGLHRPGIVAVMGQLTARGVAAHVRMHRESQLGGRAGAGHNLAKRRVRERACALRHKDRGRVRILPYHLAERAECDAI